MGSDVAELDRIWKRFNWLEEWKQFTKSEQPAHRVRVDGFWMYSYDVSICSAITTTAMRTPLRSACFRPTALVYMTWPATYGSGAKTGPMLATIAILCQRIRTVRAMDNRVRCGAARSTRLPPLRESHDASATLRRSGTTKRASVAFNEATLSTGIRT